VFLTLASLTTFVAYVPGQNWRAFIFPFVWAPGWSAYMVMVPSIVADLTDLDELQTGKRREGSYASVMAFFMKLATTGVGPLIGVVLEYLVRFDTSLGSNQLPETWLRMKIWTMIVPCVFAGLAFLLLLKFPLTKQRVQEVRARLEARRAGLRDDIPRGPSAGAFPTE
jgi:GPH family glycoside/pentoside/hexuronide:cation symporter